MNFDLHIHSNRSPDSFSSIGNILNYAVKRGLQGIAITDHGISATDEFTDTAEKKGIWLIKGNEAHTDIGDLIGLFILKPLRSTKAGDLIDEIHDQGGIAVLPHPFKYTCTYPVRILEKIDAVEIVNARWKDLSRSTTDTRVTEMLSIIRGRTAGSDGHFPFETGRAQWVTTAIATPDQLKQTIVSGRGHARLCRCSDRLDPLSQCVKLLKNPSPKQLVRAVYRAGRSLGLTRRIKQHGAE